jgi:hypothetical protein
MQDAKVFIGRAYADAQASANDSFQEVWEDWAAQNRFAPLDELANGEQHRASLVVFSPYGTMIYWVGAIFPAGTAVPSGYQSFSLPAATAATVSKKAGMMFHEYPVSMAVSQGVTALDQAGFELPEYFGQTATPYYLEDYTLTDGKVAQVTYTVYVGADKDYGFDDVD